MPNLKDKAQQLLSLADIQINGSRPWDIQVKNEGFYHRVLAGGSLALGESYMEGWWESGRLDETMTKILSSHLETKVKPAGYLFSYLKANFLNAQRKSKAFEIGEAHYDIGNDLYSAMLDKRMTYTCGYWKHANNLNEAQENKLDLVCRKIGLKAGDKILDIGCGWGSFMKFAAEKYGVSCVGVTVSKEQMELGRKLCAGLPIEFRLQDYRELNEKFDHIVSLGMFEHVGYKNYKTYMEVVSRNLKDEGLFLLHTIGGNKSVKSTDPWIAKYIFTNSMLPSIAQISKSLEGLFVVEDWHNFGADYDKTLMAWYENFKTAWPQLQSKYSSKINGQFYRMWEFYLLTCAGSFRSRMNQLWQIVLSKNGVRGGYKSIR